MGPAFPTRPWTFAGLSFFLAWAPPAAEAAAAPVATAGDGAPPRVPRVSGWFMRADLDAAVAFARVRDLDTPRPHMGPAGSLAVGQVVTPWLALGLRVWGQLGWANPGARQRLGQGAVLLDGTFRPLPRKNLLLRTSLGVGGGAVREAGRKGRAGFGGPVFALDVSYAFFPGVRRYRPYRAGGFFLAPHVGYVVATPAAKGRPMAQSVVAGLAVGFYFGE